MPCGQHCLLLVCWNTCGTCFYQFAGQELYLIFRSVIHREVDDLAFRSEHM